MLNFDVKAKITILIIIFLLASGIVFYLLKNTIPEYSGVLTPLAGTLFATGFVTILYRFFLDDLNIQKIKDELTPHTDILEKSRQGFEENKFGLTGVENSFCNRDNEIFLASMKRDLKQTANLKLSGVTLRQFLQEEGVFYNILQGCHSQNRLKMVRAIVANPFNKHLIKRSLWEQGIKFEKECQSNPKEFFRAQAFKDITDSIKGFNKLKNGTANFELKAFDGEPCMWLVITDDHAYFQPYAYGKPRSNAGQGFCIGQWFLVIMFNRKSPYYEALNNHFEHTWDNQENLDLTEIMKKIENKENEIVEAWKKLT